MVYKVSLMVLQAPVFKQGWLSRTPEQAMQLCITLVPSGTGCVAPTRICGTFLQGRHSRQRQALCKQTVRGAGAPMGGSCGLLVKQQDADIIMRMVLLGFIKDLIPLTFLCLCTAACWFFFFLFLIAYYKTGFIFS